MFCTQCGTKLPGDANFCFRCGAKTVSAVASTDLSANGETTFVHAKCTNCGANLEVDPRQRTASCSYCSAEFLVEQAIHNHNINVAGNMNIEKATISFQGDKKNLLARARTFEESIEWEDALKYYDRVLDIDFEDKEATDGRERCKTKIDWYRQAVEAQENLLWDDALIYYRLIIDMDESCGIKNQLVVQRRDMLQQAMDDYVYFNETIPGFFSNERLEVKKDCVVLITAKGEETVYRFDQMSKVCKGFGGGLTFSYPGHWTSVFIAVTSGKEIAEFIQSVKDGKLPSLREFNIKYNLNYIELIQEMKQ